MRNLQQQKMKRIELKELVIRHTKAQLKNVITMTMPNSEPTKELQGRELNRIAQFFDLHLTAATDVQGNIDYELRKAQLEKRKHLTKVRKELQSKIVTFQNAAFDKYSLQSTVDDYERAIMLDNSDIATPKFSLSHIQSVVTQGIPLVPAGLFKAKS